MEALVHNLNTMHSRAGAQTPFSSVNYGMDTSPEGRMVIKNMLLATEEGLGSGETPIFPVQIFRVKEGVNYNPEDPNYDLFKLAMHCSAKRLFPNFSFLDAPFNAQYYKGTPETEIAYMGCRTRVMGNVYDPDREVTPGRGNLSLHVHQPAASGHPRQGRPRPVLRPARLQAAAGDWPAGRALRDPGAQARVQRAVPHGPGRVDRFREALAHRRAARGAEARHADHRASSVWPSAWWR